jgi:hypothetical protein
MVSFGVQIDLNAASLLFEYGLYKQKSFYPETEKGW